MDEGNKSELQTEISRFPGSRWWKFDFHAHTPASTDYGSGLDQLKLKKRTPREWLMDFISSGIECVAVTDHNCGEWIDPLKAELERMREEGIRGTKRLFLFPGVELSTIAGAHFLAIFSPNATTQTISKLLAVARYNDDRNNAKGYCQEDVPTICAEVQRLGGLFIPAHVDEQKTGLFSRCQQLASLKPILDCEGIRAMELQNPGYAFPALYRDSKINWASIIGSDSHHPALLYPNQSISRPAYPGSHFTWVKMGTPTLDSLQLALHDGNDFSLIRSDEQPQGFDPNKTPNCWIESLEVSNARLMGRGVGREARFSFNPWMNAVIGGRGSGKSTLVHFIRLIAKREDDLEWLGANESQNPVLKNLKSFASIGSRAEPNRGALQENTRAVLIYTKGDARFRLTWTSNKRDTLVECWNTEADAWTIASSQDVVNRFPIRIFSQGEIIAIAERPEALLARVDESIEKADWDARWDAEVNRYVNLGTKVRMLRSQLGEKDRLKGQLEDICKQLTTFENNEHAKIRKDFQQFNRQEREIRALFGSFSSLIDRLSNIRGSFLLPDLSEDISNQAITTNADLRKIDSALRLEVLKSARILEEVEQEMNLLLAQKTTELEGCDWSKAKAKAIEAHEHLITKLKEQGVEDTAAFSTLVARRQQIEKTLKEIDGVEKTIDSLVCEALDCLENLLKMRAELRSMRQAFLQEQLGDNPFVQITLKPFGGEEDMDRVEGDMRAILGCEDARFADAIREKEKSSGFVELLYRDVPSDESDYIKTITARVKEWKDKVLRAGKGMLVDLPNRFRGYLANHYKANPEFLDRLMVWWPEDSLVVSYSRSGDGKDFVPLTTGSAGQKSAALLAFFLASGDTPLVIDQPENDLDNCLITDLVVKQLRANKKRRQILVVTHNPNIVVNGDAEMVYAMNFAAGQCQAKASGPLQEENVRTEVCEVMEGGRLALTCRFERLT